MEIEIFLVIGLFIFGFGMISGRIQKSVITPPMIFVLFGVLAGGQGLGIIHINAESPVVDLLAELTLVIVLFTDAARIDLKIVRQQFGLPIRLLGIGLPLTIVLGTMAAMIIFPSFTIWEAAILATILAPTDAALGQAVVSSPRIPVRIRQLLNVESGLNDGIGVPIITILLALANTASDPGSASFWTQFTLKQIIFGPLAGLAVGYIGGQLLLIGVRSGWMNSLFHKLAGLALALVAFSLAELIGGNGLIASFCAGLIIGTTAKTACEALHEFNEVEGQLLILFTFMVFGAAMVWPALDHMTWRTVLYAVLSLTIIRMAGVAISLIGTKLHRDTFLFLGWFGPRGVASILFGLLVLESENIAHHEEIFIAAIFTILLSVFAHGLTAWPGANWYANQAESMQDEPDMPEFDLVPEMPTRVSG